MSDQTFDLNTLHEKRAEEAVVREANAYRTLRTGNYRLTVEKAEGRIASEKSPWPGTEMVHLQVDAKPLIEGERGGKLFVDITYVTLRKQDGQLDGPSKLWGQYEKALGCTGKSAGEVVESIRLYPVDGYVTESFKTPMGYRTPKTEEERAEFMKSGFEPRNFLQNVRAAR
jgi:hypothetical protein